MDRMRPFEVTYRLLCKRTNTLLSNLLLLGDCIECNDRERQLQEALSVAVVAEKVTLLARSLPVHTGHPEARRWVEKVWRQEIPAEIGFTERGWFSLRMPLLLPKKAGGSANYIRDFLYPAMRDFFEGKPAVRYSDAVLIYRHVYARDYPERQKRDHDNLEINMVSDTVALYVLPDDGPSVCAHYYCSAAAEIERTEVYVVPKADFAEWLAEEPQMPTEGVKLYENHP